MGDSSSSSAQSANAQELINRLHDLGQILVKRRAAGMSNQAVPAPYDTNGEHKLAQRRLEDICAMIRPAAEDLDAWREAVASVEIPGKIEENDDAGRGRGRGRAAGRTTSGSSGERSILDGLPAQEQAEVQRMFDQMNGSDHRKDPPQTVRITLAHMAVGLNNVNGIQMTTKLQRQGKQRAMSGSEETVEVYLPMRCMRAAVTQLWRLLDELNLGVPQAEYRPENDMEWDLEEDFGEE